MSTPLSSSAIRENDIVLITGIEKKPELNDCTGRVESEIPGPTRRFQVVLSDGRGPFSIAESKLTKVDENEPGYLDKDTRSILRVGDFCEVTISIEDSAPDKDMNIIPQARVVLEKPLDIRKTRWQVRFQDFTKAAVSSKNIKLVESHKISNRPIVSKQDISEDENCLNRYRRRADQRVMQVEIVDSKKEDNRTIKINRPKNTTKRGGKLIEELPYLYPMGITWGIDEGYRTLEQAGVAEAIFQNEQMLYPLVNQKELDSHFNYFKWVGHCMSTTAENGKGHTQKDYQLMCEKSGSFFGTFSKSSKAHDPNSTEIIGFDKFVERWGHPQPNPNFRNSGLKGAPIDEDAPVMCDFCHRYAIINEMPQCECGEYYCSAACRLADWESHKSICAQARDTSELSATINRMWLASRGVTHDLEGRLIDLKKGSEAPKLFGEYGSLQPDVCPMMEACAQQ